MSDSGSRAMKKLRHSLLCLSFGWFTIITPA